MDDNLIAQATLFLVGLAADLWELYIWVPQWISAYLGEGNDVAWIIWGFWIYGTLWVLWQLYFWAFGYLRVRRTEQLVRAIDESFAGESHRSFGLNHEFTEDYRLKTVALLRQLVEQQQRLENELARLRLHMKQSTDSTDR